MQTNRQALKLTLLAVLIAALALTLWLLFQPSAYSTSTGGIVDPGIGVSASRTRLPLAGNCFDLTWNAPPDAAVTLDGAPVQSSGTQSLCAFRDHTYVLELANAAQATRVEIPVSVVTGSPLFWIVAVTPLILLLTLVQMQIPGVLTAPLDRHTPIPVIELVVVIAGFALLTLLLWIPYGFAGNVSVDQWEYRSWFVSDIFPLFHAPISPQRPFTYINEWFNYLLTPETFVTTNLLLYGYMVVKSILTWALVRRLVPSQPILALGVAVLALLHPMEQFYLGAVSLQMTLVILLITAHLLLSYWRRPTILRFNLALIFALLSSATYEAAIPTLFFMPLILLIDTPRLSRRWWTVAAIWVVMPIFWMAYFGVWLISSPSTYFDRSLEAQDATIPQAIVRGYANILTARYWDMREALIAAIRPLDVSTLLLGAAGVVITAIMGWRLALNRAVERFPVRLLIPFVIGGLGVILLGIAMYLPSGFRTSYIYLLRHPYFISTLGAALIFAAIITLIPRRWLQTLLLALIAGVSVIHLLAMHDILQRTWGGRAHAFVLITEALPAVASGAEIVLVDDSQYDDVGKFLFQAVFDSGVRTLYEDPNVHARNCLSVVDQLPAPDTDAYKLFPCMFTPEGLNAPGYEANRDAPPYVVYRGERELLPYDRLVILHYTDERGMELLETIPPEWVEASGADTSAYDPLAWVDVDAPLPRRVESMLMPAERYFP
ncbi:MAG: hypothetical protein IAE80_05150 [Anaerolinea sp.]|nr:hypothetical protein [Anaerolinea sp.]